MLSQLYRSIVLGLGILGLMKVRQVLSDKNGLHEVLKLRKGLSLLMMMTMMVMWGFLALTTTTTTTVYLCRQLCLYYLFIREFLDTFFE